MKNIFIYLTLLLLTVGKGNAQQLIGTAGSVQNNVSWSIGELINETATANNITIIQGFNQQAAGVISAIDKVINHSFSYYPNPVVDKLRLTLENINFYTWKLTDLTGRILKQKSSCMEMEIDMSAMARGQYVLTILTDEFNKSVVVIKN